jgi:hypothetical protein
MLFWNKICGFCVIFFIYSNSLKAQGAIFKLKSTAQLSKTEFVKLISTDPNKESFVQTNGLSVIPQNYYTQHFGIMCKQELAIEKAIKIPLRFRLGSLQQCNYLEGKK